MMKYHAILLYMIVNSAHCFDLQESINKASKIIDLATASVTYERKDEFTFSKPHILDDFSNDRVSPTTVSFDDAIALVKILDKNKRVLVVRMAKGTIDKGDESAILVHSIVDRFMNAGYKRVVVLENRGFGIPINYDTENR